MIIHINMRNSSKKIKKSLTVMKTNRRLVSIWRVRVRVKTRGTVKVRKTIEGLWFEILCKY